MATQFEQIMGKLDRILDEVVHMHQHVHDQTGDLDFNQEVPSEGDDPVHVPQSYVEVSMPDGSKETMSWFELDDRIVQAIQLSNQKGTPYQLYKSTADGPVRIGVDQAVAHELVKNETPQAPVPRVGDHEIDALRTEDNG